MAAVVKILLFLVGIGLLRSMMRLATPPIVSMERERGVTSIKMMSLAAAALPTISSPESFCP